MDKLDHRHILVSATVANPPTQAGQFDEWLKELVQKVDMKVLMGPWSIYCETEGNEGVTGLICLETSHASGHFWHEPEPFLKMDLYSCKHFEVQTILDHLAVWQPKEVNYTLVDRNGKKDVIVEQETITFK
jgi:S-adenosylmethionine/arginine decarboxylase-like enzyme